MIYFDNAATSFFKPYSVQQIVKNSFNNYTANPGRSGHKLSQKIAEKIFDTRENLKKFFNAENYSVVFTKNCTEALNLSIFSCVDAGDHVITTCYEHNSVLRPLESLKHKGVEITILDCDLKDFSTEIRKYIKNNTKLVVTTFISNVTGEKCNVEEVSNICRKFNLIYIVDGAQACGHIDIDLKKLDVDVLTFAGHKGLMSITGVGGLLVKNGVKLKPLLYGGTGTDSINLVQPTSSIEGFESGTLPSISILSLNEGVKYLSKNFEKIIKKEEKLSKYLYFCLKKLKFLEIYSNENAFNVVSFNFKNYDSSAVANMLDEKFNICVRSGLHCAPLIHKKLKTQNKGAVRVSIDFNNTFQEIDMFINILQKMSTI